MSNRSEGPTFNHEIPGMISLISKQNTYINPSLVQEIWEFQHDPDDQFLHTILHRGDSEAIKRHSYRQLSSSKIFETNTNSKNIKKRNEHSSEVTIQFEKRNEYGLINRRKYDNDRKTVHRKLREKQNTHRDSKVSRKCTSQSPPTCVQIKQISINSSDEKSQAEVFDELKNRNVAILQRKYISNLTQMIHQHKQLLALNKYYQLEHEKEQIKKCYMKMEIQCRKLRIGLRTNHSNSKLHEYQKKHEKKKYFTKNTKSNMTEKEGQLMEKIVREKKKLSELMTRDSLLTNYYSVMKTNPTHEGQKSTQNFQPKTSKVILTEQQKVNHFRLLSNKLQIQKACILEASQHISKKCEQISSQCQLLKKQTQIINDKIHRLGTYSHKKEQGILFHRSKSSKLVLQPKLGEKSTIHRNKLKIRSPHQNKSPQFTHQNQYSSDHIRPHRQQPKKSKFQSRLTKHNSNQYFNDFKYQ